ncbi:MAG: family transposase [Bacteroidota bacterium]|nr:family transposase [Bacteroidota bacterium]
MKINYSMELTQKIQEIMSTDLLGALYELYPVEKLRKYKSKSNKRDRVYNAENTAITMIATALQEDKSLQSSVNIFNRIHNKNIEMIETNQKEYEEKARAEDVSSPKHAGRPKKYRIRVAKSKQKDLSLNTSSYSQARTRLDIEYLLEVYKHSTEQPGLEIPTKWKGREVYISDGTYLQMQDSQELKEIYQVKKSNGEAMDGYPQALLEVILHQGSGIVSDFKLGSRHVSELELIRDLIQRIPAGSLLLADDLYCTYAIFCLLKKQGVDIIVPGKRDRNYRVILEIAKGDEIVELKRTKHPDWLASETELPETIIMRRITYEHPEHPGEESVLYTSILSEEIDKADIIIKYESRWDIEITIRETKTIMDINVIRSKSPEMVIKELLAALIAYNLLRKIIVQSSLKRDFSPEAGIIQKCFEDSRIILIDKKGRIYNRWSPGRNGYIINKNIEIQNNFQTKQAL